jgi:hypothetical protein
MGLGECECSKKMKEALQSFEKNPYKLYRDKAKQKAYAYLYNLYSGKYLEKYFTFGEFIDACYRKEVVNTSPIYLKNIAIYSTEKI